MKMEKFYIVVAVAVLAVVRSRPEYQQRLKVSSEDAWQNGE